MSPDESFVWSLSRSTARSMPGLWDSAPATAGRGPPAASASSGSPGCQTCRNATIAPVESSDATMSVSSIEM